jgi:hypothetical protein
VQERACQNSNSSKILLSIAILEINALKVEIGSICLELYKTLNFFKMPAQDKFSLSTLIP